jgi:hypothetical protein
MRPWVEGVDGIPPEQVIGSFVKTRFVLRSGQPVLERLPEIDFIATRPASPSPSTNSLVAHGLWQLRRRPGNAPVDGRRCEPAFLPLRPPHRRGARVRLRPRIALWQARQGPRRGESERLDGRDESRLEQNLSVSQRNKIPLLLLPSQSHPRRPDGVLHFEDSGHGTMERRSSPSCGEASAMRWSTNSEWFLSTSEPSMIFALVRRFRSAVWAACLSCLIRSSSCLSQLRVVRFSAGERSGFP